MHPTLAILAGGAGSRMGRAKGELRIGDVPILAYLLRHIAWPGPTLLVTAPGREHPPAWEQFDREVVDPVADQGPLRGVLTALGHATTDLVAVTTVDMPGVRREQLEWLIAQLGDADSLATRRGGRVESFPSAFSRRAAAPIRHHLAGGRRAVHEVFVRTPDAPPAWDWTNLNRVEDLQAFLTEMRARS